jgi:hypothetical protein
MSEALNVNQDNESNSSPTGWEELANATPSHVDGMPPMPKIGSESLAPDHEKQAEADHSEALSARRDRLRSIIRKSIVDAVRQSNDWDGDGINDNHENGDTGKTRSSSKEAILDDEVPAIEEWSDSQLNEWLNDLLTDGHESDVVSDDRIEAIGNEDTIASPNGFFTVNGAPINSEQITEPPIVTEAPEWLTSWEKKQKNL